VNPQDPLANLHPLRQPELIGWWPLAPGWWLLLSIALLGAAALVYFLVRRYRANAYRRRALQQLQRLQQEYLVDHDASDYLAKTNALLKSVALVSYPQREVAARSGDEWLIFLNSRLGAAEQFEQGFVTGAYQRVCPQMDMEQMHRSATTWIKRHEVTR